MADGTTRERQLAPRPVAAPATRPAPPRRYAPRLLTCRRHIDLLRVCSAG
ncbi:hypothetical protein RM844_08970 [Streptomyces sp. DSM 44915]|uniref:Uncharacterized protein n=1 Tax=Streptomyces chisholmiae TaxID=3075540 RepID=A0ABU2JN76_9ACTN|nr:hypothetical protein [Streptomyces sp. DSM 44915]MDT0266427.1 hypothetical protein [Streptomyces sp. DSM 44915]